jgi:Fe-S-cluster containining protein
MESAQLTPQMKHEIQTHGLNVERVALRVLRTNGTGAEAMAQADEMYDRVMQKVDARYRPQYACAPGCAHCCAAEVTVAPPEAELLVRHVKATRTPDEIEDLKTRMRAVLEARRAGGRPRCAFLGEDTLCTVYAVRPLKCRACNSDDVDPCKRWEEEGAEETTLRTFTLPRMYAMLTVFGVLKALAPAAPPSQVRHTELMETMLRLL